MKKIFFNGKVYDHNKNHSLFDIQQEIQQELDQDTGHITKSTTDNVRAA